MKTEAIWKKRSSAVFWQGKQRVFIIVKPQQIDLLLISNVIEATMKTGKLLFINETLKD
jgi:hypothetical protein